MRSCDRTCGGSSAGPSPNWAAYDSSWVISKVRRRRSSRLGEAGWDPEPGLALVRLAQGDVALAAASIRDALDHPLNVPSKELPPNTDLRRAPLLAARVEIEVAAGDLVGARDAADELARVAASFESKALAASAAMADGRVRLAAGDIAGARHAFETAVRLWSLVGAPHEAALARTGLAHASSATGAEVDARLESGPAPPPAGTRQVDEGQRNPNVFRQEGDYWSISFQGHTVALRDLKGLHYLARLLAHPGREFHVLDLVASGVAPDAAPPGYDRSGANARMGGFGCAARRPGQERLPPAARGDR